MPTLDLPPPQAPAPELRPLSYWEEPLTRWDLALRAPRARPGAFDPLTVDVKLGVGFNGFTSGPLGVVLSFLGWVGLDGTVDVGVFRTGPVSFGLGAEVFYDRPLLVEKVGELFLSVVSREEGSWDIQMWHTGFTGRASVHLDPTALGLEGGEGVDPYAVFLLGPRWARYGIEYTSENLGEGSAEYREAGLRTGLGLGINGVSDKGLMGTAELRYLVGTRFVTSSAVDIVNAQGEPLLQWEQQKWEQPPRGFSWAFSIGYRF